ncbi:hypothetical protein [Neorhizobium sp. S3-V5DH]|uniref:hypothetical protein n=1 Tax=Neorhizobium sp. S3-V5DH TaxID=2485166 RepID=UPI0010495D93|nr:hypothetical protein [Neorhizobium sp. S3-V5DH]TCV75931.1 hypothetical protein EDE09_101214 [Neorhizobium sp. S3-V5DH]
MPKSSDENIYTITAFRHRYGLPAREARQIFDSFGPRRADLDAFMAAYLNPAGVEHWVMDVSSIRSSP